MDLRHYVKLAQEFFMFGVIGAVGFVANVTSVYMVRGIIGLYWGGLFAWFVAASVTWFLNRNWTFRDRSQTPMLRQWFFFLLANSFGFMLYYAVYVVLITYSLLCAGHPIIAIFAGTIAGMFANFALSRGVVFR